MTIANSHNCAVGIAKAPLYMGCVFNINTVHKGLFKLGNIVAETMFLVMFPGVAKLGNICFGRKICVREAKMFLTP